MSSTLAIRSQQAAAQIVALINSSPRSPRPDEIEAIIAALAPASCDQAVLAHAEHIRQLGQKIDDAYARGQEGVVDGDRFNAELDKITNASWSTPPRSIADLYIRAEIARYWHQDVGEPWDEPDDCDDWGNRAVAELIHAVLQLVEVR